MGGTLTMARGCVRRARNGRIDLQELPSRARKEAGHFRERPRTPGTTGSGPLCQGTQVQSIGRGGFRMKLFAVMLAAFAAQSASAQAPEVKTAEQVYKNIQQLKGTPADQLSAAMQFISVSLGVDCETCHVAGKFDADDKNAKKTAREMMAMTAAINKDSFRGQRQVTCYSCHRGSLRPAAVPPVQESDTPTRPTPPTPPAAGAPAPTVDDIVAKYLAAVGGADAMKKITSRTMKGTVMAMGGESAIDLYTKAPNKRVSISHQSPTSDSYTAFDGTAGWLGATGHAAREMSPTEAFASSLDADFYLVAHLKDLFPQLRRGRPADVAGVM